MYQNFVLLVIRNRCWRIILYEEIEKALSFYCNSNVKSFSSCKTSFDDAKYVILGVPYDRTSSFRPGSRFAPSYIREASLNIETYNLETMLDLEDLKICDIGDLNVVDNLEKTLRSLEIVIGEIIKANKIPIIIGGEHTITAGSFKALSKESVIIIFDAHLDLRHEFMGTKFSHATFVRRLLMENINSEKIILVGTRAVCKEEIDYAKKSELSYITTDDIKHNGSNKIIKKIESEISDFDKIYISLDMDVLDPSFAPAVGNPEGFGINTTQLMDILGALCTQKLIGFDLVEVSPHYDQGITAILAANIFFNVISLTEKSINIFQSSH